MFERRLIGTRRHILMTHRTRFDGRPNTEISGEAPVGPCFVRCISLLDDPSLLLAKLTPVHVREAHPVVASVLDEGEITHPRLGVKVDDVNEFTGLHKEYSRERPLSALALDL